MSSASSPESSKKPLLSNGAYNFLKNTAIVILPAIGALYFALAQIWNLPKAEEVVGSIAAANTFVGVLVGISTKSYNNSDEKYAGSLISESHPLDENQQILVAHLNKPVATVRGMNEAVFKVGE